MKTRILQRKKSSKKYSKIIKKNKKRSVLKNKAHIGVLRIGKKSLRGGGLDVVPKLNNLEQYSILTGFKETEVTNENIRIAQDNKYKNWLQTQNNLNSNQNDYNLKLWYNKNNFIWLKGHTDFINCIVFGPEEKYIITGSNKELIIWSIDKNVKVQVQVVSIYKRGIDLLFINSIVFKTIDEIVFNDNSNIIIFSIKNKTHTEIITKHTKIITCINFSDTLNYLISGSKDKTLKIWKLNEYNIYICINTLSFSKTNIIDSPIITNIKFEDNDKNSTYKLTCNYNYKYIIIYDYINIWNGKFLITKNDTINYNPPDEILYKKPKYHGPLLESQTGNFTISKKINIKMNKSSLKDTFMQIIYNQKLFIIKPLNLNVPILQSFIDNNNIEIKDNNYISFKKKSIEVHYNKIGNYYNRSGSNLIEVYEDNTDIEKQEEQNIDCFINDPADETKKGICYGISVYGQRFFRTKGKLNNDETISIDNKVIFDKKKNYEVVIQEDITWYKTLLDDLNTKLHDGKRKIDRFLETNGRQPQNFFLCDDLNCVEIEKIIIKEIKKDGTPITKIPINTFNNNIPIPNSSNTQIEEDTFVIIGYPDKKMKTYLKLCKEKEYETNFKKIYNNDNINFMLYMAELHNFIKKDEKDKINIENLTDEIHKFYDYKKYYLYTENYYNNLLLSEREKLEELIKTQSLNSIQQNFFDITIDNLNSYEPQNAITLIIDEYFNAKYKITYKQYFENYYKIPFDPYFKQKFKDLQKAFYNENANKNLNKPMIEINYVFLILKKNIDGIYIPALFNFRALNHNYYPVIKYIDDELIKKTLPHIYGIIDISKDKDGYKLFNSYCTYGTIFHIKTEYIHTMRNYLRRGYLFNKMISIEEIIYMLSIENIELKNLKILYEKKPSDIFEIEVKKKEFKSYENYKLLKIKSTLNVNTNTNTLTHNTTSKQIKTNVNKEKEKEKNIKKEKKDSINILIDKKTKILLMFIETGSIYSFVYKNNENFYIIKLIPKLTKIYKEIIQELEKPQGDFGINKFDYIIDNYETNILNNEYLDLLDISNLNLYKISECYKITPDYYKNIMRYNPLIVKIIEKQNFKDTIINSNNVFNIKQLLPLPLSLPLPLPLQFPNPYYTKSIMIRNPLATKKYLENYNNYFHNNNINIFNNDTLDINILQEKYTFNFYYQIPDNELIIHKIYFNYNECGYNFIELKEKTKSVVWVVPKNSTYSETLEENVSSEYKFIPNFTSLNHIHINMLQSIIDLYSINNNECFFNIGSLQPIAQCLHIHVLPNETYKTTFTPLEQGSRIEKFMNLKKAINLLNLNKNYFNNYKIQSLVHDKQ